MEKLRWHYKNGHFEEYSVLYKDDDYILVQNDETKSFSFGPRYNFGSLYGFPVNTSCLTAKEAITELREWIKIDMGFSLSAIGRWSCMIEAIKNVEKI